MQETYGGNKVDGENLLTNVELTGSEARSLAKRYSVLAVEKDVILTGDTAEASDDAASQWNLDAIGVTGDETSVASGNKVKVAVIDSGISFTGDIFAMESADFVNDGNENPLFDDASGHGTAVSGIICAADDDIGITGINPNVELYSAKVLDSNNQSPLSRVLQGIYWAIENDVDIINMSFGTDADSEILHNAVRDAYNAGILLVASSGNTAGGAVKYPAAYSEVIAVGATTPAGGLWSDTSTGEELELLAPGEKILTSGFLGGTLSTSGTSIAAAEVSAVASLLMQRDASKSADFIRALLSASAKRVGDYGLIDYAYASEIYDDFANWYEESEDQTAAFSNEAAPTDYSDSAESVVEGMWSSSNHGLMAEEASNSNNANLSAGYTKVVQYACANVDTYYGKNNDTEHNCDDVSENQKVLQKKVQAFHGRGNFVANIRYISNFAQYMGQGLTLDAALEKCQTKFPNLITKVSSRVYTAADVDANNPPDSKHPTDGQVMEYMTKAVIEIYKDLIDDTRLGRLTSDSGKIGPKRRMLIYLGVALHMIGDVYAHRTIVPTNMVVEASDKVENGGFAISQFCAGDFNNSEITASKAELSNYVSVVSPFLWKDKIEDLKYNNWKNFEQSVNWQIVEFQDIFLFQKTSSTTKYDDNVLFAKERFSDAKKCCNAYLKDIISKNFPDFTDVQKFYVKYLFPASDKVVLNNFKNYATLANLETSGYANSSWSAHSTSSYV
ncbi:MAG: S8 family serine peptidase [Oscillospiraceae bacterium]|nr:S8 family serine peptidase [Oscillospiraceae bacterium]